MIKGRNFWLLAAAASLLAVFVIAFIASGVVAALLPKESCVGVIQINGEITTGPSAGSLFSSPSAGSDDIVSLLEEADGRREVKAVLLEVNSPGGSVVGTREIYESVQGLHKPSVSYFREMAASGGYYVAAGTGYIISDPAALTGSIGVRMTTVDLSGLFGKLGYNETDIKSGEMKDMGSSARPLSDAERAVLQSIVNESFADFKSAVERGRAGKLDQAKFEQILDARVLTGRQAKEVGLVDEIGNRKLALKKAAALANISYSGDLPRVCAIENERSVFDGLLTASADFVAGVVVRVLNAGAGEGTRVRY